MLNFADPRMLIYAIVALIFVVFFSLYAQRRRQRLLERIVAVRLVNQLTYNLSMKRRWLKKWLLIISSFFVFAALARPQFGFQFQEVKRKGIDIIFAVDTSKSMLADDIKPNRLVRAGLGIADFVQRLEGDRVGLIPFAGGAFLLCPLTLDYAAFLRSVEELDVDIIPRGGTNISRAIVEARQSVIKDGNKKVLIIISDGEELEGDAVQEANKAASEGFVIYTVGLGTAAGELIRYQGENKKAEFVKDRKGRVIKSSLDEGTLRRIAEAGGGIYQPFGSGGEGLDRIYQEKLKLLPRQELAEKMQRVPIEKFELFLFAALLCLLIEALIGERKKELKSRLILFLVVALFYPAYLQAAPREAAKAFEDGRYEEAMKHYLDALREEPEDPRLQYNYAVSAYRAGNYEQAIEAFKKSIKMGLGAEKQEEVQQKAYYNLGNSLFRRGEEKEQSEPKEALNDWQEALQAFNGAIALGAEDKDAVFNQKVVKRRLEKLKEEIEKEAQKKEGQDSSKEQERQNKPEQEEGGASSSTQESENEDSDQEGDESSNSSHGSEQVKPNDGGGSSTGIDDQGTSMEFSGQSSSGKMELKSGNQTEERKQGMTPEEARALLDSLQGEEKKVLIIPDESELGKEGKGFKDW